MRINAVQLSEGACFEIASVEFMPPLDGIRRVRVNLCSGTACWLARNLFCCCFRNQCLSDSLHVQERLTTWFAGSGDPEVEDAVDPCEFLTRTYAHDQASLMKDLHALQHKLDELDPTWIGQSITSELHVLRAKPLLVSGVCPTHSSIAWVAPPSCLGCVQHCCLVYGGVPTIS